MLDNLVNNLYKYAIEGLAVAVAAYYLPGRSSSLEEVAMIGLTAAVTLMVLDEFSPATGSGARQGVGLGIGYNLVRGPGGASVPAPAPAPAPAPVPAPAI